MAQSIWFVLEESNVIGGFWMLVSSAQIWKIFTDVENC